MSEPGWMRQYRAKFKLPLGDIAEKVIKPIAVAAGADCLDDNHQLKPESRCAKNKAVLNEAGNKLARLIRGA